MSGTVYADPGVLFARMLRRCVRTESGCWQFTGSTNSRGYASVGSGKRSRSVLGHQLAVMARGEAVPPGSNIDHACHDSKTCEGGNSCPHRRCVNPSHVRVVTCGDNTRRRWGYLVAAERPERIPTPPPREVQEWVADLLARHRSVVDSLPDG